MNILLLQSDNALSEMVEKTLFDQDYACFVADSFNSAREILESRNHINLLIADLDACDNSAYDLILYMRNNEYYKATPAVIFSAEKDHPLFDKCRDFKEIYPYLEDFSQESLINIVEGKGYNEGKKILLVDDEDMVRDVLKVALEREGFEILEACSGQEALDQLKGNEVAMVISDFKMPEMSGQELLETVKEDNPQMPFFLISGYLGDATNSDLFRSGADGFIAKPFKFTDIISAVRKGISGAPAV